MLRDRLLFFVPLALTAAALTLFALARKQLQLDLPIWVYGSLFVGMTCISWRTSLRLDRTHRETTRLDGYRAAMILALGLTIATATGVLRCGITSQPITRCLTLPKATEFALVAVLFAPLVEEILLRGYLGRLLVLLGMPVLLQLAVQGSLFAFTHGGATSSSRFALFFAAGLLLTVLAITTQGLLASLMFHVAWNACQPLVSGDLRGTGLTSDQIATAMHTSRFAGAAALLIMAAAVWRRWMPSAASAATGLTRAPR